MKFKVIVLMCLLCVINLGCGGVGGDPEHVIFASIVGPTEITENQNVVYTADAGGAANLTFGWSCEPPDAGVFSSNNTYSTTFTPAEIIGETRSISIAVIVNGDDAATLIVSLAINILNSD